MGLQVGQEVSVLTHTLKGVTNSLPGAQGEKKAVMAAAVASSTQWSAPAQNISSALTKIANGNCIPENAADQASQTTGRFRDHTAVDRVDCRAVARQLPNSDHREVARVVLMANAQLVAMVNPIWVRECSPHFFSY